MELDSPIKLCKDCKYYEKKISFSVCGNPNIRKEINLETGEFERSFVDFERIYSYPGRCGPEGKLFEQKEPELGFLDKIIQFIKSLNK
jgi:hypothetical protein